MDYVALKAEIDNDPANVGYAAHVASGSDLAIADLLNAGGAGTVVMDVVDKGAFLIGIAPAVLALAVADAATKDKWDRILSVITGSPGSIHVGDATVQGLLALAVSEGLLSSNQVTALTHKSGSRAEILFGAGTKVSHTEVAVALRGGSIG